MSLSLGFSAKFEHVAAIDKVLIQRRLAHPEQSFSRSDYVRQATLRALAEDDPEIRVRHREAPVKPVSSASTA